MNLFVLHMFLVLGVILSVAVVLFSGGGKNRLYISSGDGTGKPRMVRRSAPMPIENVIFMLVGIGCAVALYLTHFNLCVFLGYWMPGLNLSFLRGICSVGAG